MSDLTDAVSRQYDLFQGSLESLDKQQKYLNYGYTVTGRESYEERQERLCLEVFRAAQIGKDHVLADVGFGSGEQDFLLARTYPFAKLTGFNIAARQVEYAAARAVRENEPRLEFRHGAAEVLPGLEARSVDRLMAIECAFYFDRPRFYARAAEVLKPGGLLVLADIAFSTSLLMWRADFRRVGTRERNRVEWEKFFDTVSITDIRKETRPGAQMTVRQILRTVPDGRVNRSARREWLKMAFYSQLVALGLSTRLLHYDLIVLRRRSE
jgi:ubiquinone/menaquinone biosynthesis C-methylase UbiE